MTPYCATVACSNTERKILDNENVWVTAVAHTFSFNKPVVFHSELPKIFKE